MTGFQDWEVSIDMSTPVFVQLQVRGNSHRHELAAHGKADTELLCSVLEEVLRDTVLLLGERKTPNQTKEDVANNDRSKPPLFVLGNDNTSTVRSSTIELGTSPAD